MEYRVLGKLEALRGGHPIDLGALRQRALLALLLTAPNSVFSSDQIIDGLWGADGGTDKQNALWVYVSGLRKALEPDREKRSEGSILLTRAPGYLIEAAPEQIDAVRFELMVAEGRALADIDPAAASLVLGEALALWRGRAFEEFTYESFAQTEIARLEELRIEAVEARIDADLKRGMSRELISELETLVRQHPLKERLTGQLMLALYRSARQADALRAYQQLRSRLGEELGIEPSSRLRRLEGQIVTGDETLESHSQAPVPGGGPEPGLAVRGYELREKIGEGASGVAYRAYQPAVGREVAIKVIRPELANDPHFIRRFQAEAQLIARLEHPHIVPLYDYWREPDAAYLVMRLMRGGSLDTILEHRALTLAQTATMVDQLCHALQTAHRAGVIHGDINPANVLIDDEGNAYLSDFGIAVGAEVGAPYVPSASSPVGGPYASPEQLDCGEVTAGSDIYSLGVVVCQALTGLGGEIAQIRGALPPPVLRIIDRCTDVDVTRRYQDVEAFATDLHEALSAASGARTVTPERTIELDNPYKGLRAFDTTDAVDFYGRERLVERLITRLGQPGTRSRFIAIVGPSGSGKSSVVKAGLLPAIRGGAVPSSGSWFTIEMTPAPHPFEELEAALLGVAVDPPAFLLEQLAGEHGLQRALRRVLPNDGSQLLLMIDQFEELFTQVDAATADRFVATLVSAVTDDRSRVRVVVTLRADFYDRPLQHRGLGELLRDSTEVITPMSPHELDRAITGPVEQLGISFEPALVADLVREVVDRPGALPLLQYTMTELFDHRRGDRIDRTTYEEVGGVSGSLVKRAEGLLAGLGDGAHDVTRQVLLRLVTFTEGADDTRRRVLRSELEQLDVDRGLLQRVLDTFGRHRLLSFDRDPVARSPTVEISHEALLTEWARLRRWIGGARDDVRNQRRLAEAMGEWIAADRAETYLLRGGLLEQMHGWAATSSLPLSGPERAFLDASVAERDREVREVGERELRAAQADARQNRRLRRALSAVAVLLVAALFGGLIAYQQRQTAQRNERVAQGEERQAALTALTSSAAALRSNRLDLAALLAVEAHRIAPSAATRSALFGTFTTSPGLMRIVHTDLDVTGVNLDVSVLADTDVMVVQDGFGGADVIDTGAGVRRHLEGPVDVSGYAWFFVSADGRYAASIWNPYTAAENTADNYGLLTAWELSTGKRRFEPVRIPFAAARMAISADGSMVAASQMRSGAVRVYDGTNGQPLSSVDELPRPERFDGVGSTAPLAFLPGGNLVIGSMAGPLRIVNPADGAEVARIESPPLTTNNFLWLTRDATHAVTLGYSSWKGNWDTPISTFDLEAGRRVKPEPTPMHTQCNQTSYADQIGAILCATWGGRVLALDVTTGAEIDRPLDPQQGPVCGLAVTPDGTRLIELTSCLDRAAAFAEWRLDGGGPVSRLVVDAPTPNPSSTVGFGYGGDDSALVVEFATPPDEQPVTHVIDTASGHVLERFPGVYGLFPTADPNVAIAGFEDGTIGRYDVARRDAVGPTIDPGFEIQGVWTSGNRVVLKGPGDDGRSNLRGFDLDSAAPVGPIVIADDGWQFIDVVIVDDVMYTVELGPRWRIQPRDAMTGEVIGDSADDYRNVASNGQITIASTVNGRIFQADPVTLQPIGTPFPGTTGPASGLQLSRDGTLLMVRGDDETLRFYDVATRTPLGDPIDLNRFFTESAAVLRPDGRQAAAVSNQGIVVWDLDPAHWVAAACRVAGRNLTQDEWNQYIGDLAAYQRTCPEYPAA